MKTRIIPEVGDFFEVTGYFCFHNKSGGTGISDSDFNEKYTGPTPIVQITKVWYDEECGYRCHAHPVNKELMEYLQIVADPNRQVVFVSEFDLRPIQTEWDHQDPETKVFRAMEGGTDGC